MNVSGEMFGEVVGPGEALAAHLTVVRSLAGVDSEVPGEVALAAESSAAEEAYEGSFAGMLAHVQLQILLRSDALSAERTSKSTFASVWHIVHSSQAQVRFYKNWWCYSFILVGIRLGVRRSSRVFFFRAGSFFLTIRL